MASSYPDGHVGNKISETVAFVDKTRSELEERFGLLYVHGQPRVFDETERQKMMGLYKMLEDMKGSINRFQEDSSKVCGTYTSGFQQKRDVEEREPKGRLRVDRNPESGYKSEDLSSVYSLSAHSYSRLSRADSNGANVISREAAEFFDPSISGISTSGSAEQLTEKKEATSFYLETPATSATSLPNMDVPGRQTFDISNPAAEQDAAINPPAVQAVPKETNDLSKPPSEEDNTKYAFVSTSSIH